MTDPSAIVAAAERALAEGRIDEARRLAAALKSAHDPAVKRIIVRLRDLDLRKHLRQNRFEDFRREAGSAQALRLVVARSQGPAAITALAQVVPAADAGSSDPQGRLAAAIANPDLRAGLAILRRLPGLAGVAEGWMAVLRGDLTRAEAAFTAVLTASGVGPAVALRARAGLAICLARADRVAEAKTHWDALAPLPQTLYPAASAFARSLTRTRVGWDVAGLRRLLVQGTWDEVKNAAQACPPDQPRIRGWLHLRLGDLRWLAGGEQGDQRSLTDWAQAAKDAPELRADVLKRTFLVQLRSGPGGGRAELIALQRELETRFGPEISRRGIALLTAGLPNQASESLNLPCGPKDPVEFARLHFQRLAQRRASYEDFSFGYRPKSGNSQAGDKLIKRLDPLYEDDPVYRSDRRRLRDSLGLFADLRKDICAEIERDPTTAEELLPMFLRAVRSGRVIKAKTLIPLIERIHRSLGRCDYDLLVLHALYSGGDVSVKMALAERLDGPMRKVFRFEIGLDQNFDPSVTGIDEAADRQIIKLYQHIRTMSKKSARAVVKILVSRPDRLHVLLTHHRGGMGASLIPFCRAWSDLAPKDWRPWFHLGLDAAEYEDHPDQAASLLRRARKLMQDEPEVATVDRLLERISAHQDAFGHAFAEDGDEDDDVDDDMDGMDGMNGEDDPHSGHEGSFSSPFSPHPHQAARGKGTQPGPIPAAPALPEDLLEYLGPAMVRAMSEVVSSIERKQVPALIKLLNLYVLFREDRNAAVREVWSLSNPDRRTCRDLAERFRLALVPHDPGAADEFSRIAKLLESLLP